MVDLALSPASQHTPTIGITAAQPTKMIEAHADRQEQGIIDIHPLEQPSQQ